MWGKRREKKKNERTSPEWGALCYHGNSSDVRAGIMWLLIESVEERANKTGTITHTQGDGQSSCYTHAHSYTHKHTHTYTHTHTHTHTHTQHTNKNICIHTQTHSRSATLNKKQTDYTLREQFYNPDSGNSSQFYKCSRVGMQNVQSQCLLDNLGAERGNNVEQLGAETSTRVSSRWLRTTSVTCRPDSEEHKHYLISDNHNQDITGWICVFCILHTLTHVWQSTSNMHADMHTIVRHNTHTSTHTPTHTHTHTHKHTSSRHLPHILHWELKHC